MSNNSEVWVGGNMQSFFVDVTKAFAQHSGPSEIITAHGPETHGHELLHSQINLINRSDGNCLKIKFTE
jgi:hypothetical protein